jgi:hypothetical protein
MNRGSEPGGWLELGERGLEGSVVFPEFDGKIDDRRPDLKAGKQVIGRAGAGLHGRTQHDVRAGKAGLRGQARELRPVNTASHQDAVQGEEHVALFGERSGDRGQRSGERGCGKQLTK